MNNHKITFKSALELWAEDEIKKNMEENKMRICDKCKSKEVRKTVRISQGGEEKFKWDYCQKCYVELYELTYGKKHISKIRRSTK